MGCKNKSESGFSLIEVSIAMTVLALLLVPALKIYENELAKERMENERALVTNVKGALQKYVLINRVYPFPADPTIAYGDANFGKAVANNIAPLKVCDPADPGTSDEVCVICDPSEPNPNVKKSCPSGARATDGSFTDNRILIGAVPFTDLGLPVEQAMDYEGNKLTYAVTYKLTQPVTGATPETGFDNTHGAIAVSTHWRVETPTPDEGYTDEFNHHFVILSAGYDRKNAFSMMGGVRANDDCTSGSVDDENCDYDGKFIINTEFTDINNALHYDDFVASTTTMTSDLWSIKPATPHIIARNFEGKIAIGYTEPSDNTYVPKARIDVKGNVKASEVATNRFCRDVSTYVTPGNSLPNAYDTATKSYKNFNCFQPQYIGGTISPPATDGNGIYCPSGKAITGIKSANQVCGSLGLQSAVVTKLGNCLTAGQYPCGVSKNQKIMCGPPGWTAGQCVEQ